MTVKSASPRQRQGQPPTGGRRQAADESSAHPTNREPMIELFDEPDEFVVTADIPGLQLAEIAAKCETGELVLTINSPAMTGPATHRAAPSTRRLAIAALTPEHSARVRVNHGILEIRIAKQASQNTSS
jgi:HSP20 family molecular chaperone IbpA